MVFRYYLLSVLSVIFTTGLLSQQEDLTKYVNPFIGTQGEGHCFPGAVVPFGMIQPGPDTHLPEFNRKAFPWCAGYQYSDSFIIGFSQTHFSGTGHSDMGDFLIMPSVGELFLNSGDDGAGNGYRSRFLKKDENASPGYYSVVFADNEIKTDVTASASTAFYRFHFPETDTARIILDLVSSIYNYDGKVAWSDVRVLDEYTVAGYRQTKGWAADRKLFFVMRFSKPVNSYGLVNDEDFYYRGFGYRGKYVMNIPHQYGRKVKGFFNFTGLSSEPLLVKISVSAVGTDGAMNNLHSEIPHWDFEKVREDAKRLWQNELSKFLVDAPLKEKEIFYTSVYHSFLSPFLYTDSDRRYRGLDGNVHHADNFMNYSTYSLWDTYRALHPLFTIVQRERVPDMINTMLRHSEQSPHGILPVWSFHANETWCMIGYHSVSVIADAVLKGITGFDYEKALNACIYSASYEKYGGLGHYMKYGYVPQDLEKEGASKTLEYAYDDWCISVMAGILGKVETEKDFLKRSEYFRNIWDNESRFFRAKNSDGKWNEPFDPLFAKYGGDYTEGNAWQYSWYVPHDVSALIMLHGGENKFIEKLDSLFIIKAEDEKYRQVEDIAGLIGQYAHGNEPSQHIAYLYNYAGAPWKAQEKIHRIMSNLFNNTPDGICGNEDCGQMSAWYIFSSMGFYPVCPGSGQYVIGTPKLNKAEINFDNGKKFTVTAVNLSGENYYIGKIMLNGKPLERSFITHDEIISGGKLVFYMDSKPNRNWASQKQDRPFSVTAYK